jgi:hypothetical protein
MWLDFYGKGWTEEPKINVESPRRIKIEKGRVALPSYFNIYELKQAWEIDVPALNAPPGALIKRTDNLYIVSLVAQVTAKHDSSLAVTFAFRKENTTDIVVDTKENERRFRSFVAIILSAEELTPESFYKKLPVVTNEQQQSQQVVVITNKTSTGQAVGDMQLWAFDGNWVNDVPYVIEPALIDLVKVCQINRSQNITENGITVGKDGEEPFTQSYTIKPACDRARTSLSQEAIAYRRMMQLFTGVPGTGGGYQKFVLNLAAGPVGNNPGFPGIATSSPNGSAALANGQRISFSNQACRQDCLGLFLTAGNDGTGNAEVVFPLASGVPDGTYFGSVGHRIFAVNGTEISGFGSFRGLGQSGALIWTAGANARNFVLPGQKVWFVPVIEFPGGSGSNVPFAVVERVWLNTVELTRANIRAAAFQDLDSYETPSNGELYFVVTGSERAALVHYILQNVKVQASDKGVVSAPLDKGIGCFAFIKGVKNSDGTARLDKPVVGGLQPNETYDALVYKAPASGENWQFQVRSPIYEGTGESNFLDGSTVVSLPLAFAHTQGSGTSVFVGEASCQFSPIAMFLPIGSSGIAYYQLDAPIQWGGEGYAGDTTFRLLGLIPGSGLALPSPGTKLKWEQSSIAPPRSIRGKLTTELGDPIGFRAPQLQSGLPYQALMGFLVQKGSAVRLVVITHNSVGNKSVAADTDLGTGIDLFRI